MKRKDNRETAGPDKKIVHPHEVVKLHTELNHPGFPGKCPGFCRIALNMAQQYPKQISKRRKIKCSCWSDDFRMEMFFGMKSKAMTLKKFHPVLRH